MRTETPGSDRLAARMRESITSAVRAGGQLRGRPQALAAFLAASAFAPFLAPAAGAGEFGVLLSQLGSLGSGYLAALLTSAAEWNEPDSLAMVIEAGLEAPGERGAGLRAEVSGALRQIGAVEAVMAADPQAARELAELGGQLAEFGWMLGDATEQLAQLVRLGARHGSDLQAARAELGALNVLLQRLVPAQDQGREPAAAGPARCPYPGMRPFESRDAARFFGREDLTAHLLARLAEQASVPAPLLVFGPSGAGKSSLLRAGLIPAIRRGLLPVAGSARWPRFLVDRPGRDPLAALAAAMGGLAADGDPFVIAAGLGPPGQFVLVADQLEEIFTQCADGRARAHFVRVLVALAARGLVVLGVRADFYQDCAGIAELSALLADNQVVVGPLAEGDLRRAITLPAARAGHTVEAGLPELMIADLGLRPGQSGYAPGALPLLGYALQANWNRRAGAALTVAGYRDAGGIHGAVAAEAERIYEDLPPAGREAARRLLLRMVSVGPDGQLTRRQVSRAELLDGLEPPGPEQAGPDETGPPGAGAGATGLARLTQARLVTADEDGAEITHEAFLTAWPRLAGWIAEDRAGLRLHRQLGEDARAWDRDGRDPGSLYRGTRLAVAAAWRAGREADPTRLELEFLTASTTAQNAVRDRERRRSRRLRVLTAGLALALVAALAAAGVAAGQQRQAVAQRGLAVSAQFAAQSANDLGVNLRQSDLEAMAAWQAQRTPAARGSLLSRQADPYLGSFPEPAGDQPTAIAVSPGGAVIAVAMQPGFSPSANQHASVQLWAAASHRLLATLPQGAQVQALTFSPDGRTLAAVADQRPQLRLWDVASHRRLADPFPETSAISTVAFSPDGQTLAIGLVLKVPARKVPSQDLGRATTAIDLWATASHRRRRRLTGLSGIIWTLAFSPDGRLLASGSQDGAVQLWGTARGIRRARLDRESGPVRTVLFSPDGQHVAVSAIDGRVTVLDLASRTSSVAFTVSNVVTAPIAFGAQGKYLYAATGIVGSVGRYDVDAGARVIPDYEPPSTTLQLASSGTTLAAAGTGSLFVLDPGQRTFVHPGVASENAIATTPGGRLVATGANDGTIALWAPADPARSRPLTGEQSPVDGLAVSSDGRLLAATFANCDTRVWQLGPGRPPRMLRTLSGPPGSAGAKLERSEVSFVPRRHALITDCSYVTSAPADASVTTVTVRDTGTWRPRASLQLPGGGSIAVSPDGKTAAAGTEDGTIRLLSTGSYRVTRRIRSGLGEDIPVLAFSPDSRLLAVAGTARNNTTGAIGLWRTATGSRVASIGPESSAVRYLAFSPGGKTLAAASQDATVRLWSLATRQLAASLTPFPGLLGSQLTTTVVGQVAFLPGNRLITAVNDGSATVWDLSPADEIRRLCAALHPAQVATWWRALRPSPGPSPCARP
jgi:WD40 repeat protein